MMVERYIFYDIENFIKDYNTNKNALNNLMAQVEELSELPTMAGERVQKALSVDGLEKQVLRRIALDRDIQQYQEYFNVYNRAYQSLTEQEQLIVDCIREHNSIESLCEKLGYEKSATYERKNKALNKFKILVFG